MIGQWMIAAVVNMRKMEEKIIKRKGERMLKNSSLVLGL